MLATLFSPPFLRMLGSRAWMALSITEAQWSVFIALRGLFFVIFILAVGVMADFWGRRRILRLALAAFIVLTLIIAFIPFGSVALVSYIVLSILGVVVRTLALTMVILVLERRERLLGLAIYSAFSGGAYLLSPYISKTILQSAGVRMLFVLPAVLAVVGYLLVTKKIPESRAFANVKRNDVIALTSLSFSLCVLIFAGILAGGLGWTHPVVLTGFATGGGLLLALIWLQDVSTAKRWQFKLYFERQLSIAIFAGVILNIGLCAITLQVFNFLYKVQEHTIVSSGLAVLSILAGAFLLSALTTRLTNRLKVREALAAGLLVVAIPAIGLYFLEPDLSPWVIALFLIVLGFGFILGNSPRLMLLTSSVPLDLVATVQAIGSATSQLGGALAYSFMLTLLEGFGRQAYTILLSTIGLSSEEITNRIMSLANASEEISLVFPPKTQTEILHKADYFLKKAYLMGLSQTMLVLAGVCVFSAMVVYVGLRNQKKGSINLDSLETSLK
jgi:DHA2 family methylenomycin A resistance protein-like MFS transporter